MNRHSSGMGRRSSKKGRISHMKITPHSNGFLAETHYHAPEDGGMPPMPDSSVHNSVASLKNHVGDTMGAAPDGQDGEATQGTPSPAGGAEMA